MFAGCINTHHKQFSIAGDIAALSLYRLPFQNVFVVCVGQKYFSQESVFFFFSVVRFYLISCLLHAWFTDQEGNCIGLKQAGACIGNGL